VSSRAAKVAVREAATTVLTVDQLHIDRLRSNRQAQTIVSSFSLSVAAGETVAIVGESGSGKSMTARAITGLLPPALVAKGEVSYGGRNLLSLKEREWRRIRGREIGLVLQDPFTMLNPVMRCGRILEESTLERGLSRKARRTAAIARLSEVGIHDPSVVERYPFELSGGMRQRVAIAAALARDPTVLIADEPSTALDVTTQREILSLIKSIQIARNMALILITHDLRVAFGMCDRIYVLYAGSLVETAPSAALESEPLHPYSHGLLLSEPPADYRMRELLTIPGAVPSPDEVADSCSFAPRCRWAAAECVQAKPPLEQVVPERLSACVRLHDIRGEMAAVRDRATGEVHAAVAISDEPSLIRVENIHKVFRRGNRRVVALEDVSIVIRPNESVGLVGESGSGKTTLARMLVGLEAATSGEIIIDGVSASNWADLTQKQKRRLRDSVQIVFQDPYSSLNPTLSIGATLNEAITTRDPRARNVSARAAELLDAVGLPAAYARRKPAALSGGERQRIAIARALAANPRILICDEPVSALDMSVQAQVLNLLSTLKRTHGLGLLFITHDLAIVRQMTDRLYVIYRGRIVESGTTAAVLDSPNDPYTIKLMASIPRADVGWLESTRTIGTGLPQVSAHSARSTSR